MTLTGAMGHAARLQSAADTANTVEAVVSTSREDPDWDRFVIQGQSPHHEQTALWGGLQSLRGWQPFRLKLFRAHTLVGGAQILERRVPRAGRIGYLPRGPLVIPEDASLLRFLLQAIRRIASERRLVYLAVNLPYPSHITAAELEEAGFSLRHEQLPPSTPMGATIVLDLTQDNQNLLAQMRATTRKHIRQGQRRGTTVREGGAEDMDTFGRLLVSLCARRGVRPNIPQGDFLRKLWQTFAPGGYLKLFVAENSHEALSGMMVFSMGRWARSWRVGSSGSYPEARPNELMYWEAIQWARANGCQHFDFAGFDTGNARSILEGRAIPEDERCGMSDFKLGFGGRIMLLPPGFCCFCHPMIHWLYSSIGGPLLNSNLLRRLLPGTTADV